MDKLILRKNEEGRIKQGHLWVFSNEIDKIERSEESRVKNGDLISIYDYKDNYLASGFYNANSLIAVRVLTSKKEFDLTALLLEKLLAAFNLRKTIYPDRESFRMVFSESDFLPGLIIDKYNNTFVLQIYSFGMEVNIDLITKILVEKFDAENIFTKNEEYFRRLEGLPAEDKIYVGKAENLSIDDGFIKYIIDFSSSHKTGFYFDQCDNREFAGKFCKDKSVLDGFCNSGGFGLHAALNGASSVTFVDSSGHELENSESNFNVNGFTCESEFVSSDLFDFFEKCVEQKRKFDVIVIDPPAFAKNKKNLSKAIKGYEKLNRLAMQSISDNGLLFTSSCSYHLKENQFIELISSAAVKAGRQVQLFYFNNASKDHPILPSMEETVYLKFAALKVM